MRGVVLSLIPLLLMGLALLPACGGVGDSLESVNGRVVEVQARSITEIESFSLLDEDGVTWFFTTEGPLELTPSHLREHMLAAEEIGVSFQRVGDGMVARGLSDYP